MTDPTHFFDDVKDKEPKDTVANFFDDVPDKEQIKRPEWPIKRNTPQEIDNYKRTFDAVTDPKAIWEDVKGLVKFPFELIDASNRKIQNGLNYIMGLDDYQKAKFWKKLESVEGNHSVLPDFVTDEMKANAKAEYDEALTGKIKADAEHGGPPTLYSLTIGQIPAAFHMGQTIVNADTPEERGAAIRHFLELFVFAGAHVKGEAAKALKAAKEMQGEVTPEIREVVKPAAVAQNNVVNEIARSLPVEGEQAAIKNRLMTEGRENLISSIVKAHNDVHPAGTTIIPSLDSPGEAIALAKKSNPLLRTALFKKENGGYDLAIFGDKSPLAEGDNLKEFEKNGYFPLEEVSKQGGRFIYRGTLDNGALKLSKLSDPSQSIYVSPYDVRRPPFSERAFPFVETPQAPDIIRARVGTTRLLSREEVIFDKFNQFAKDAYGDKEVSWDNKVSSFIKSIGLPAEEASGLKNFLEYRTAKELRETYLSADEKELFDRVADKVKEETGQFPTTFQVANKIIEGGHTLPLDLEAATNGHKLDMASNGDYILRDSKNNILMRAKTEQSVRDYLSKVGQTSGDELIPNSSIPVNAIGSGAMPPSGNPPPLGAHLDGLSTPYKPPEIDFFRKLIDRFRVANDWDVTRIAHFESVDELFKTQVMKHLRGLDTKYSAYKNALAPYAELADKFSHALKSLTIEKWHDVTRYLNAMSAEEMPKAGGYFKERAMTEYEIRYGEDVAKLGDIDVHKAIRFSRLAKDIKDNILSGVEQGDLDDKVKASKIYQDIAKEVAQLGLSMGMDDSHMAAAGIFEALRNKDFDTHNIGAIAAYADALINKAPTQAEFAKLNNMSPAQLRVAKELETAYENVRKNYVNVPDQRLLSRYTHHIESQVDAPTINAAFLFQKGFGKGLEEKFVGELIRTGELGTYEMNPVSAFFRYASNAIKSKDFNPAFNVAIEQLFGNRGRNIVGELNRIPEKSREGINDHVKRYLSDLRGIRPAAARLTSEAFSTLTDNLRANPGPTSVDKITNGLLNVTGSAYLAGRPQIALRHAAWFYSAFGSRFDFSTATRGLVLAADEAEIAALKKQGILSEITTTSITGPADEEASLASKGIAHGSEILSKFRRTGTKLSGLSYVYEHTYAAAYLGFREKALASINKIVTAGPNERASIREAEYSKLFVNSFPDPTIKEFDDLVSSNRVNDAAAMLAKEAARKTVFDYSNANYPRGWNTNIGRFLSMFGIFPTYMNEFVSDMLTRGTKAEKARFISKFAISQGAIFAAGRVAGIDLSGATMLHAFGPYSGSPQASMLQTIYTAAHGRGGEKKIAQYKLYKLIPSLNDPSSMIFPASYAVGDWVKAINTFNDPRRTILQAAGRALGFPVIKEKSWLDDYIPTIR